MSMNNNYSKLFSVDSKRDLEGETIPTAEMITKFPKLFYNIKWGDIIQVNSKYRNHNMYFWDLNQIIPIDSKGPGLGYGSIPRSFSPLDPKNKHLAIDYFEKSMYHNNYYHHFQFAWYKDELISNCKLSNDKQQVITNFTRNDNEICTIEEVISDVYTPNYLQGCEQACMSYSGIDGYVYKYNILDYNDFRLDPRLWQYFIKNDLFPSFEIHIPNIIGEQFQDIICKMIAEDISNHKLNEQVIITTFIDYLQTKITHLAKMNDSIHYYCV